MNRVILRTLTGSHQWGMNRPDSDKDYFTVYAVPTRDILSGRNKGRGNHFSSTDEADETRHEVAHVVDMLLKCNVNFVQGVLSPCVEEATNAAEALRRIVAENPAKGIFESVQGMGRANYIDYAVRGRTALEYDPDWPEWLRKAHARIHKEGLAGKEVSANRADMSQKKAGQILRIVRFARTLMETGEYRFAAVPWEECTPRGVLSELEGLQAAYDASPLPHAPDEEPFREWLLALRLEDL